MRYSLDQLREYRDLLEQIQALESSPMGGKTVKPCPKCEARRKVVSSIPRDEDGRWAVSEQHLLDVALSPLPEGASGRRRLKRDYRCSICNGIGHNAATCDTLDYETDHEEGI